jgi:hypothetical protein
MMILLSTEGITHEIWLAVFIYLASHDRLMNDLRVSPRHELIQIFQANGELVRKYIIGHLWKPQRYFSKNFILL